MIYSAERGDFMKRVFCILMVFMCFLIYGGTANAGNFSLLASTGRLSLDNEQAWSKSYKTERGTFKVQFRKLRNASDKKKYHLIIWWDGKEIADGYSPKLDGGYRFEIFREDTTDRVFVSLETMQRIVIMGYDPKAGRLEKYIDSQDYNSAPTPQLFVNMNNDLILSYASTGNGYPPCYKFIWDENKRWFDYQDITQKKKIKLPKVTEPPKPDKVDVTPVEDEPTYYSPNDTPTVSYEEPTYHEEEVQVAVIPQVYEEELYYEETVVVGS